VSSVHVVRHAHAGDRNAWSGDDQLRPLSPKGRRQAEAIAERLAARGVDRLLSSGFTRCVETLEPLGHLRVAPIEVAPELAEGADPDDALALVLGLEGTEAALCSHGDVIPGLMVLLARKGVELVDGRPLRDGDVLRCGKGSTWELELDGGAVVRAAYIPPPGKA
jgi:phosphohistidine phosphatase SixA